MKNIVSSEIIITNVKSFLSSFDSVDLIEDSDLYNWIMWVINRLGVGVKVEDEYIVKIKDYKAPLPPNFDTLWCIHSCDLCEGLPRTHDIEFSKKTVYEKRIFFNDGDCYIRRHDDPTIVTETWSYKVKDDMTTRYCNRTPLSLGRGIDKKRIHHDCINVYNRCENEFTLDSKQFYFNFTDKYIHVQYFATPFDEEGYPQVVNDEYVLKALEDYLIFKCLQKIFINGLVDVKERMGYYEQQSNKSLGEALFNQKLDTFNSFVKSGREKPNSLEIFNLRSTSDARVYKS